MGSSVKPHTRGANPRCSCEECTLQRIGRVRKPEGFVLWAQDLALGFRVEDLGFRISSLGFRMKD